MSLKPPFLQLNGILLVHKPKDWTSHDVCAFVRKKFNIKKVGHAGTLDPMATGLLILLLGKATKMSMELSASDKEYAGTMQLGVKTDSHDMTGEILEQASWENISLKDVQEKAKEFTGEIVQVPPMVSALKHKGVRLYKLARKGQTIEREGRDVTVFNLTFDKKENEFIHFSTRVSKGTYVRTLVNDIGEELGCFGSLSQLSRTQCGDFNLNDSISIEDLRNLKSEELSSKVYPMRSMAVQAKV